NTTKPYFKLWFSQDSVRKQFDTPQFRALNGKSSIGDIIRGCSAPAAGGGKRWKGGAYMEGHLSPHPLPTEGEQTDDEQEMDQMIDPFDPNQMFDPDQINVEPPPTDQYNTIQTWAVLWIEDEEGEGEEPTHMGPDNQIVFLDSEKFWKDKGPTSIQYTPPEYAGTNIFLINKSSEFNPPVLVNTASSSIPLSIVSTPIYYYFNGDENPVFMDKDTMDKFLNSEILNFLKGITGGDSILQHFVFNNQYTEISAYETTLGDLVNSYMKNTSDIKLANILLGSIQEIAYEQATETAKTLWKGSRPWEWNDGEGEGESEGEGEGERAKFEKAKETEIHNMFSRQLPNFEPTEFFDTTTEYSLERTVQNGIHLYLNQTSSAGPTSSSGDGLSAGPTSLGNTGSAAEEDEDSPSEEEAGKYKQDIYDQEYSTLTRLFGLSKEEADAAAQKTADEAFRAYLLGWLYRRERADGVKYIYESLRTRAIQSNAPTSSIGGSNKEGENIKISNEEAYALYLIYSGSDNSNVMPGIPLVNSPKEYQDNNNLFFKYMSKIINNTSISDSYHIATLINLKEEVKADDKSKIELAGETKKKINLEPLIVDSRLPQEAPAAAAAAGGKKRKKRKTKKRRKKNKKTISNSKYLNKKTKQKKRRKKKSLKN
ncbi:hypothetical protein N9O88_01935, partial [bacterium]|nr:hypothetical protein [bacterium]